MLKIVLIRFSLLLSVFFVLTACNQEPGPSIPTEFNTLRDGRIGITIPVNSWGYGIANKLTIVVDSLEQYQRTSGTACFYDTLVSIGNIKNVGNVSINAKAMALYPNNCYTINTGEGLEQVIDFSSGSIWSIVGGGGVIVPDTITGGAFPSSPVIRNLPVIDIDTNFTVLNFPVTGAYEVVYAIGNASGKFVYKVKTGTSTSCTFTKEELSELGASSQGIIQVNAYNIKQVNAIYIHNTIPLLRPKPHHFINNTVYVLQNVLMN